MFVFATASRPALGPTQPPVQWIPEVLSLEVKRPAIEAGYSLPSSTKVKNAWSCISIPPIRLHDAMFSYEKDRDNFTFAFYMGCT
jgi:hypothetical protein